MKRSLLVMRVGEEGGEAILKKARGEEGLFACIDP